MPAGDDFDGMVDTTRMISLDNPDGDPAAEAGPGRVEALPAGPQPWLEVIEGEQAGETLMITKPLVMLGRVPNVADVVVKDGLASRHHAAIGHYGGVFTLYDMGSTNGTFVGDERIHAVRLSDGTEFRIGDTRLVFRRG